MRALILALFCSLAGALPQQGQPRDQPARREAATSETGAISGRVYAIDTGAPIRGAIVSLVLDAARDNSAPAVTQLPFVTGRAERGPVASTDAARMRFPADPNPNRW